GNRTTTRSGCWQSGHSLEMRTKRFIDLPRIDRSRIERTLPVTPPLVRGLAFRRRLCLGSGWTLDHRGVPYHFPNGWFPSGEDSMMDLPQERWWHWLVISTLCAAFVGVCCSGHCCPIFGA